MDDFKPYRRSQIAQLRPYVPGEDLGDRVSIGAPDREAGSPKEGDMIARNPANHDDQWLVAAAYFAANFERADEPGGGNTSEEIEGIASRGARDPSSLTPEEVQRACASLLSQAIRRPGERPA